MLNMMCHGLEGMAQTLSPAGEPAVPNSSFMAEYV